MADKATEPNVVSATEKTDTQDSDTASYLRPPVDIFEDSGGITVLADMPGVSKEKLQLKVDHDSLTVEGEVTIDIPDGMAALYADVQATRYHRSFTLSSELDADAIDASLKDGLLRIRIPKRPEAQPRKIEVQVR